MVLFEGIDFGPLLPEHLSEIVVGIVLFVILWAVISKKVMPAFEKTYEQRANEIRGGIERAEKAQAEAARVLAEYNDNLADAREEAARIREEAKTQGAQIIAEMKQQASEESARMLAAAKTHIAAEREQAVSQLRAEIGGLAVELAEKIVQESLKSDERIERTVERFISELEAKQA